MHVSTSQTGAQSRLVRVNISHSNVHFGLRYVWEHLDVGYMQGMCDLVAPLLVILDEESSTYACFCRLMDRMGANFPNGGAMDTHFANMR